MKIGCNYSKELITLIHDHHVQVDLIKIGYFGPFLGLHDEISQIRPLLIHGFGHFEHIGMTAPEQNNDWKEMNTILKKYQVPHLGVHFSIYDYDIDSDLDYHIRQQLDDGVSIFKNSLNIPILLENIDYNPYYQRDCVKKEAVDPDFITYICNKYDVDLLLDTAHASVSAYHLNMDTYDYLKALPLKRVKEIHLIGTQLTDNQGLKDMHTELKSHDYELLDWLRTHCKPKIITLEYGWPGADYKWRTKAHLLKEQLDYIKNNYT